MIGNAVVGRHAEQADQDHARRVEADAERHQRAEHEVADDADDEHRASEAERVAAAGQHVQRATDMHDDRARRPAAQRPCRSAPSRAASRATTPAPSHAPSTAAAIIATSVVTSTWMIGDEDERLRDGRQRVADVQRAGNHAVVAPSRNGRKSASSSRTSRCRACRRSW